MPDQTSSQLPKALVMMGFLLVAVYAISATWTWVAGAAWLISLICVSIIVSRGNRQAGP